MLHKSIFFIVCVFGLSIYAQETVDQNSLVSNVAKIIESDKLQNSENSIKEENASTTPPSFLSILPVLFYLMPSSIFLYIFLIVLLKFLIALLCFWFFRVFDEVALIFNIYSSVFFLFIFAPLSFAFGIVGARTFSVLGLGFMISLGLDLIGIVFLALFSRKNFRTRVSAIVVANLVFAVLLGVFSYFIF